MVILVPAHLGEVKLLTTVSEIAFDRAQVTCQPLRVSAANSNDLSTRDISPRLEVGQSHEPQTDHANTHISQRTARHDSDPLANDVVVFGVSADPKLQEAVGHFHCKCAMVETHSCRPDLVDLLEVH